MYLFFAHGNLGLSGFLICKFLINELAEDIPPNLEKHFLFLVRRVSEGSDFFSIRLECLFQFKKRNNIVIYYRDNAVHHLSLFCMGRSRKDDPQKRDSVNQAIRDIP